MKSVKQSPVVWYVHHVEFNETFWWQADHFCTETSNILRSQIWTWPDYLSNVWQWNHTSIIKAQSYHTPKAECVWCYSSVFGQLISTFLHISISAIYNSVSKSAPAVALNSQVMHSSFIYMNLEIKQRLMEEFGPCSKFEDLLQPNLTYLGFF